MKEWHPVHAAEEAEVRTLVGRPVTEVNSNEGIYIDEDGNVFQLAEKGRSKPMEVEQSALERETAKPDDPASANGRAPNGGKKGGTASEDHRQSRTGTDTEEERQASIDPRQICR